MLLQIFLDVVLVVILLAVHHHDGPAGINVGVELEMEQFPQTSSFISSP